MGNTAASGGYYVSAPADRIVALPATLTGSIGVISQLFFVDELLKKMYLRSEEIASGDAKGGPPFRPLTNEERRIYQG